MLWVDRDASRGTRALQAILDPTDEHCSRVPASAPSDEIVARGAQLADAFRAHNKLVAVTRVAFAPDGGDVISPRTAVNPSPVKSAPDYGALRSELGLRDSDLVITKRGWKAFYGTELDLELRRRKITGIVLAGISTSIGVESTARAANERGFELTIVTDAVTDPHESVELPLVTEGTR